MIYSKQVFIYDLYHITRLNLNILLNLIKRLIATQLHGNFTLGRFSANCPHWLRRFYLARPVTKQEYHYNYYRLSPYQKLFDIYRNCLSLPQQNKMLLIKTTSVLLDPSAVLLWLLLLQE